MLAVIGFALLAQLALAFGIPNVYLEERFDDGAEWEKRWVQSKHRSDYGMFSISRGKFYGDAQVGFGLRTTQNYRFYAASRKFDRLPDQLPKALVFQFSVKHEQNIDCGGGYIKLLSGRVNQTDFHQNSSYYIMFGPDICADRKVLRMIVRYNGTYFTWKQNVKCKAGRLTHVYTLVINQNLTYKVFIDLKMVKSGLLLEDLEISVPASNWDAKTGETAGQKGPLSTESPDKSDGQTEASTELNQHTTKSKTKANMLNRKLDNTPKKKGKVDQQINSQNSIIKLPVADLSFYTDIGAVGIDVWQVKAGTIFDNIIVTDDESYAIYFAKKTWLLYKYPEKHMKETLEEEEEIERDREQAKRLKIKFRDEGKEVKEKNREQTTSSNKEL